MKTPDRKYFFGEKGEKLLVLEWGRQDKPVIFLVHGFPGCADQGRLLMSTPYFEEFRLISFDRPGYGESDFQPDLTPLKFAGQIQQLAQHLNISQVRLLSVSGGAPYAMAIGHVMKDRVLKISSVAGVAPLTLRNFRFMNPPQKKAWMLRNLVPSPLLNYGMKKIWQSGLDRVDEFLFSDMDDFSIPDQNVFKNPLVGPALVDTVRTALKPGPSGVLHDMKIYSRSWGFSLETIRCPVTFWHGHQDDVVSVKYSLEMRKKIPHSTLKLIEGEGHYSLPMNFRDQIIEDLLEI